MDSYLEIVVCSDSKSSFVAIKNVFTTNAIIQTILQNIKQLNDSKLSVVFLWIPSHCGIWENEKIDKAAKNSTNAIIFKDINVDDLLQANKKKLLQDWENDWKNNFRTNKLWRIKKEIKIWKSAFIYKNRAHITNS